MIDREMVLGRIEPILLQHPYLKVEFTDASFRVLMENRNPNLLGNFAGGDMAYAANAAAGLRCLAEGYWTQTASINTECLSRGDGDMLVADAALMHLGSKFIRMRSDVFVRSAAGERMVAIAQVNMSRITDQNLID